MKRNKSRSLTKSARKAVFKDITLRLRNALNEAIGLMGGGSKKLKKTIKKESKKVAGNISKLIRRSPINEPAVIPATIITAQAGANVAKGNTKPASSSVKKGPPKNPKAPASLMQRENIIQGS